MIEFQHVSKHYDDGTIAVRDFSLRIPDGQLLVLLGSSGCGKTTLLRMVNRLVEPTSGRILLDDTDLDSVEAVQLRRRIGYVLQGGGLLPHRTVLDNIALQPRLVGFTKAQSRDTARRMMELVGLNPSLAQRYPSQLSGGQRQRVGVARALSVDAKVLLLDEAFSALDPIIRHDLQDEILHLHRQGMEDGSKRTLLFVTHDINEAVRLADRIILLSPGGTIEQDGTAQDLLERHANDFVAHFVEAGRPTMAQTPIDDQGSRL